MLGGGTWCAECVEPQAEPPLWSSSDAWSSWLAWSMASDAMRDDRLIVVPCAERHLSSALVCILAKRHWTNMLSWVLHGSTPGQGGRSATPVTRLRALRAVVARQAQVIPVHWASRHDGAPAASCATR